MKVRVRILDVAEVKHDQWYFDMHRGSYKPAFPMAGVIECQASYLDEWHPVEVIPPPTLIEELTKGPKTTCNHAHPEKHSASTMYWIKAYGSSTMSDSYKCRVCGCVISYCIGEDA